VRIGEDDGKGRVITIVSDDGEEDTYTVAREASRLEVADGHEITAGDPMVEGPRDPKELMEIQGVSARPSGTSSTRYRRCTATRVCRSTTSTSS
jgi:hypothetical protein